MTISEMGILSQRLKAIIRTQPETAATISKEIGISQPTLMKFLSGTSNPDFKRLYMIEAWVVKREEGRK